jgi:hypothetical protein
VVGSFFIYSHERHKRTGGSVVLAAFGCRSFHLLFGMDIMKWNKNKIKTDALIFRYQFASEVWPYEINRNLSDAEKNLIRLILFENLEN